MVSSKSRTVLHRHRPITTSVFWKRQLGCALWPHNWFPFVISFVSTPDRDNRLLNKKFEFLSQPWYPAVVFASLCLNYLLSTMLWDHMDMFFSFCSFILPTIPIYCLYCCIDVFLEYGALLPSFFWVLGELQFLFISLSLMQFIPVVIQVSSTSCMFPPAGQPPAISPPLLFCPPPFTFLYSIQQTPSLLPSVF